MIYQRSHVLHWAGGLTFVITRVSLSNLANPLFCVTVFFSLLSVLYFRFWFCVSVLSFVFLIWVLCFCFGFCVSVLGFVILFWVLWFCFEFCDSVLGFVILFWVLWFCFVPTGPRRPLCLLCVLYYLEYTKNLLRKSMQLGTLKAHTYFDGCEYWMRAICLEKLWNNAFCMRSTSVWWCSLEITRNKLYYLR